MRMMAPLLSSVLLSSCASLPASFSADSVPRTSRQEVIVLAQPVNYERPQPVPGVEGPLGGMLPGRYVAEREDSKGIFYRGAGRSQFRTDLVGVMSRHRFALFEGGIWIPKTAGETAKPYFYVEAGYPSVATFAEVLSQTAPSPGVVPDAVTPMIVQGSAVPATASPMQGAVGSAIAGAIVDAAIRMNVGKINFWPTISDRGFSEELTRQHRLAVQGMPGGSRTP